VTKPISNLMKSFDMFVVFQKDLNIFREINIFFPSLSQIEGFARCPGGEGGG
jgi:hypothetical protein